MIRLLRSSAFSHLCLLSLSFVLVFPSLLSPSSWSRYPCFLHISTTQHASPQQHLPANPCAGAGRRIAHASQQAADIPQSSHTRQRSSRRSWQGCVQLPLQVFSRIHHGLRLFLSTHSDASWLKLLSRAERPSSPRRRILPD